jgi:hypothetical protein
MAAGIQPITHGWFVGCPKNDSGASPMADLAAKLDAYPT